MEGLFENKNKNKKITWKKKNSYHREWRSPSSTGGRHSVLNFSRRKGKTIERKPKNPKNMNKLDICT